MPSSVARHAAMSLICAIAATACLSPDPPLLTTPLPGGYGFHSNGGHYGHVVAPDGGRLADYFGILEHHAERWCVEFGWQEAVVVCRYQAEFAQGSKDVGFFILDTRTGRIEIANDTVAALALLRTYSIPRMPRLAQRHPTTRKR